MNRDRARQILLDTFWESGGWRHGPAVAPDEFDIAKAAGYMFDPGVSTHDDAVTRAINAAYLIEPRDVAHAFVASLTSRRLEYRSALGSFAFARLLPHHAPENSRGRSLCDVCGDPIKDQHVDWNIQNFVFRATDQRLFYVDVKPTLFVGAESNEQNLKGIREYFVE